jgi:hypothetical protein
VRIWENVNILPKSFESSICVLPSDDSKSQPILWGNKKGSGIFFMSDSYVVESYSTRITPPNMP